MLRNWCGSVPLRISKVNGLRHPSQANPASRARVGVSGTSEKQVAAAIGDVADWLKALIASADLAAEVVGPAPAPLARIKGRWRWHAIVRCEDPRLLGRLLRYASRRAPHTKGGSVRVTFDRDPVSLL